jgi:hypothetical protein
MVPPPLSSTATDRVNYHRCKGCRHVWTTTQVGADVLTHVTEPKRTPIKTTLTPKPIKRRTG